MFDIAALGRRGDLMKRGLLLIAFAAVAGQSLAFTAFFYGDDPGTGVGTTYPEAGQDRAAWAALAGSNGSISSITYENSPIGAGVLPYSPLPGVTISMFTVQPILSGVKAINDEGKGWNLTPFGSRHLRFQPNVSSFDSLLTFKFSNQVNSFSTMITGLQANDEGIYVMEAYRGGSLVWSFNTIKPMPVGQLTCHTHMGYTTSDSFMFIDEVRLICKGPRVRESDIVGLDDTMFSYCQAVPEPATVAAIGVGVLGLIRRRRR